MKSKVSIFWFRRDLRLEDNVGLYHALSSKYPVLPVFIFDDNILGKLEDKKDRRVDYIHQALLNMNARFRSLNTRLNTFLGNPMTVALAMKVKIHSRIDTYIFSFLYTCSYP